MNKLFKKSVLIGLVIIMIFTVIACKDTVEKADDKDNEQKEGAGGIEKDKGESKDKDPIEQEPVTLRMIQRLNATYVVEDNPIIEEWGKRTNTIIEIEAPPVNNYGDRLNIVMASGDLPDIIFLNNTGALYHGWAKDGLLLELDDYFNDSMPNASKVLTDDELSVVRVPSLENGLYSLPRVQTKSYDSIIYREDWLKALDMKVPETPEEFAKTMLAFAKEDPDGNGKDDTFGWSYNRAMGPLYRSLVSGFNIRPESVPNEDGDYEIMQAQEGYMVFIDWLRDMYKNGALDPEWYLTTTYEDDDKWNAGKLGAVYANKINDHLVGGGTQKIKDVDTEAKLTVGPPLRQEGQSVADVYYNPQVWGNYAVNAESENIDHAIAFLDYGYTDECNELLVIGMEGITYESFDPVRRFVTRTEENKENADFVSNFASINFQREDKGLLVSKGDTEEELNRFLQAEEEVGGLTNRISYLSANAVPGISEALVKITDEGIDTKYDEYETKYICNEITRDQFMDFINNEYIPAYEEYINIIKESAINK
ncbi:MAG: extracellular solute-binding protein [Clostridiales bacterium]|nr:extracellular solute-binding protein [Clostridiales bacterium]